MVICIYAYVCVFRFWYISSHLDNFSKVRPTFAQRREDWNLGHKGDCGLAVRRLSWYGKNTIVYIFLIYIYLYTMIKLYHPICFICVYIIIYIYIYICANMKTCYICICVYIYNIYIYKCIYIYTYMYVCGLLMWMCSLCVQVLDRTHIQLYVKKWGPKLADLTLGWARCHVAKDNDIDRQVNLLAVLARHIDQ